MDIRTRYNGRKNKKVWRRETDGGCWETIKGCPKNTLVTIRDKDNIYFGIARANRKYDIFSKRCGQIIAQGRAEKAKENMAVAPFNIISGTLTIVLDNTGMMGSCGVENIKNLLEYFDHIDEYGTNKVSLCHKTINAKDRLQELAGVKQL